MSKNISLKKATTKQLEHELTKRRSQQITELQREKSVIEKRLRDLEINNTKDASPVATVKLPQRINKVMLKSRVVDQKSLKQRILEISADGQIRTSKEFVEIIQKDGWKTTSTNPTGVVSASLAELHNAQIMSRVSEGRYQLSSAIKA